MLFVLVFLIGEQMSATRKTFAIQIDAIIYSRTVGALPFISSVTEENDECSYVEFFFQIRKREEEFILLCYFPFLQPADNQNGKKISTSRLMAG